jgi:hypothetical protein
MELNAATYSAIASAVSAGCALFTLYMFRAQGKGFVWTRDHSISLLADQTGRIHIQIEIPLANLGKGNIKFTKLKAKKINLKTKAMENFEMDMDEAYFPEGASIITYRTAIHTEMEADEKTKLVIGRRQPPEGISDAELEQYQENLNKKIGEVPEHIVILKCSYKDGSWFGLTTRNTVIGLSIEGLSINYLSTARRRELNEYFSW